jgi:hypothetical protein
MRFGSRSRLRPGCAVTRYLPTVRQTGESSRTDTRSRARFATRKVVTIGRRGVARRPFDPARLADAEYAPAEDARPEDVTTEPPVVEDGADCPAPVAALDEPATEGTGATGAAGAAGAGAVTFGGVGTGAGGVGTTGTGGAVTGGFGRTGLGTGGAGMGGVGTVGVETVGVETVGVATVGVGTLGVPRALACAATAPAAANEMNTPQILRTEVQHR